MPQTSVEQRQSSRVEIVAAIVLATAGILTAWAGFQSQLWSGTELASYAKYSALRQQATRLQAEADELQAVEVSLFSAWLDASVSGKARLASYYRSRFPANLSRAFEPWIVLHPLETDGAPRSPFDMPTYRRADGPAVALNAKADESLRMAESANQVADSFARASVALAMAMFLGGMAQVFHARRVKAALLAISVLACLVGLVRVLSLPFAT
jgi:hypothetical protein